MRIVLAGLLLLTPLLLLSSPTSSLIASGSSDQTSYIPKPTTDSVVTQSSNIDGEGQMIESQLDSIRIVLKRIAERENMPWEALVALILGISAIFGLPEIVKNWRVKPNIKVSMQLEPPDCLKIPVTNTATGQILYDTYYLRFKVENTGNFRMEDVEVFAMELFKRKDNNVRFSKVNSFLPMHLRWSNVGEVTMPKILPGLHKHCDLGHIVQNPNPYVNLGAFGLLGRSHAVFILDTQVTPNTGSNYLLPAEYRLKVAFAANNLKPKYYWVSVKIFNRWSSNQQQMLSNNVYIDLRQIG